MNKNEGEAPSGYNLKRVPERNLSILTPAAWNEYRFEEQDTNCAIVFAENSGFSGTSEGTGIIINVYPTITGKAADTIRGYKLFLLTLPKMFKDMDPTGDLSLSDDERLVNAQQDFVSRQGTYHNKAKKGIEEIQISKERISRVRLTVDTRTGTMYFARFISSNTGAALKEDLEIADIILDSLNISPYSIKPQKKS